ncbi:glycosyltransferase [Cyclobacteriaceae bacterium YHN15]|nr:glycosyltransferase [Cyclobacteriaceae bacterium YHN15]
MKVSVVMITYNQEIYLEEAILSVLNQETNFTVELIICNDSSPDNTSEVVNKIITNHPKGNWIKYISHANNLGISENFKFALKECKGQYIALCEGDDYWIDSLKLHNQVDFLENSKDHVMVADNSIWHEIGSDQKWHFSEKPERDVEVLEMLEKRQFATASVLFRNSMEFQQNLGKIFGDTVLWVYLSNLGKIRYRTNVTSIYRRHESGSVLGTDRLDWAKTMEKWNLRIKEIAPKIPDRIIKKRIFGEYKSATDFYLKSNSYQKYFEGIFKCFMVDPMMGTLLFFKHLKYRLKKSMVFNKK